MDTQLLQVEHEAHWRAYHFIRRYVLYERRGRTGYDEAHPEERADGRIPLLFLWNGEPVATARLDHDGRDEIGTIRMVAVLPAVQGRGIGTAMMQALERLAAARGIRELRVHAARDATGFYEKNGWTVIDAERQAPLMAKPLAG